MEQLQRYVISRLKEASTWRGIVLIVTSLGLVPTTQAEGVLQIGLAVAGVIGALFPDYKE